MEFFSLLFRVLDLFLQNPKITILLKSLEKKKKKERITFIIKIISIYNLIIRNCENLTNS